MGSTGSPARFSLKASVAPIRPAGNRRRVTGLAIRRSIAVALAGNSLAAESGFPVIATGANPPSQKPNGCSAAAACDFSSNSSRHDFRQLGNEIVLSRSNRC